MNRLLRIFAPIALSALASAQTQISPNQIARGSAITTLSAAQAVSFCGSIPGCEWHITGPAAISASLTVPVNVALFFEGGGQLLPASGVTVTVNGKVSAPPGTQIFAGAGSVAGIHQVSPAWYPVGYTLAQIVNLVPDVADATILPWYGSIRSGTEASAITRTNLTILGSGGQVYSADHSAFIAGSSIIQGQLTANIPNLHIVGVGFDLGSYQAAHGGWCAGDASGNNSLGNLVDGELPGGNASSIILMDVATLGCNSGTGGHSILIEGFDGVTASNIRTYFNTRGFVSKSSHTSLYNIDSREHEGECLIFKADGTNGGAALTDLEALRLTCTHTGLIDIFGDDASLSYIRLHDVTMVSGGYIDLNGYTISHGGNVDQVDITNFRSSGAAGNALQTQGSIGNVSITGGGIVGAGAAGIFLNTGTVVVANLTIGFLSASAYGIYNNGANLTVVGGTGVQLQNAYLHGVNGASRYVGITEDGNRGIVADGNAVQLTPNPYDGWGDGNLTAPYLAQNYFAKFTPTDSHFDHAVSVTAGNTAQFVMYAANAAANQKRTMLYTDSSGVTHLALMDDVLNSATGADVFSVPRSGYTPVSFDLHTPLTAPSVTPANGFSGSKTAGACVLTIVSGIITAVSGC